MTNETIEELPFAAYQKVPLYVRQRALEVVLKKRLELTKAALATLEASRLLDTCGADGGGVFEAARFALGDYTVSSAFQKEVVGRYEDALAEGATYATEVKRELDGFVAGRAIPTHDANGNELPF